MVGDLPSDDLPPVRLPESAEVGKGQADGRVHRLGTAADQAHPTQLGGQPAVPEEFNEGDPILGHPRGDCVGDPSGTGSHRVGHLRSPVADVDGHCTASGVDDFPATREHKGAALGPLNDWWNHVGGNKGVPGGPSLIHVTKSPPSAGWFPL